MTVDVDGIPSSEWEKFHPNQFITVWKFEDRERLTFYGTTRASSIPKYLADKKLNDFLLQPINDEGEQIPLVEAIARR